MKTTLVQKHHGFLASLEQIEQMLTDYCLGKIPNIIAKTAVESGVVTADRCLELMSIGDIDSWIRHFLPSSIAAARKENTFSLGHDEGFIPGMVNWLNMTGQRYYLKDQFYVEMGNRLLTGAHGEYHWLVQKVFAESIGATLGLEIIVSTKLLQENDKLFRLDWSKFLDQIKTLVFDEFYQGVTANGLAGLFVGQVQTSRQMVRLITRNNHDFVTEMSIVNCGREDQDRRLWRVTDDVLFGPLSKEPTYLEFVFSQKQDSGPRRTPILQVEDQTKALEIATKLKEILEAA